jgi:hypothetical protein
MVANNICIDANDDCYNVTYCYFDVINDSIRAKNVEMVAYEGRIVRNFNLNLQHPEI